MKIITSATVFRDAVGVRLSATYSEIDDKTGRVIADTQRVDRVITDQAARAEAEALLAYAAQSLDD